MVWLVRPPYLRYAAAALIIAAALWLDFRPTPAVDHPFLAVDLAAGATIGPEQVDWHPIPPGLLPAVDPEGIAVADLIAGTPLVPALLTSAPTIPEGWFALELSVPDMATAGRSIRLVVDGAWADGVIIAMSDGGDPFLGTGRTALVAVPGEAAVSIADAVRRGGVTVLLGG